MMVFKHSPIFVNDYPSGECKFSHIKEVPDTDEVIGVLHFKTLFVVDSCFNMAESWYERRAVGYKCVSCGATKFNSYHRRNDIGHEEIFGDL
jgi:hypothetical protein